MMLLKLKQFLHVIIVVMFTLSTLQVQHCYVTALLWFINWHAMKDFQFWKEAVDLYQFEAIVNKSYWVMFCMFPYKLSFFMSKTVSYSFCFLLVLK